MANDSAPAGRKPLDVVRLGAGPGITAKARMAIGGESVDLEITVPNTPTPLETLLPVFQAFTNLVVGIAERKTQADGLTISCQKGCGACCRQLVPISESEALALARLVDSMPAEHQAVVRSRFTAAIQKLDSAGLLARLRQPRAEGGAALAPLGMTYLQLGIACPFLEEESCSIHQDRPLACREYLVTSPAENCSRPTRESIRAVPLSAHVGNAVRVVDTQDSHGWVPLILALEWASAHPTPRPMQSGPAWIQAVFGRLADGIPAE